MVDAETETGAAGSEQLDFTGELWSDLHQDLIRRIVRDHLPCGIDRLRLSWTNKHWGNTIRDMNLFALPLMLLPSSTNPLIFNPISKCLHKVWLPADIRNGLFCGSFGPWVFVSITEPELQQIIYNVCNGETTGRIDMPGTIIDKDGNTHSGYIDMAAISGPPSLPGYIVLAVLNKSDSYGHTVAVWQLGQQHWIEIDTLSEDNAISDIIFFDGMFHLLTNDEDLIIVVPQEDGSFKMDMHSVEARPSRELDEYFENQEGNMLRKYLVESTRGDLLFAVKKIPSLSNTTNIRVSYLSVNKAGQATWVPYTNQAGEITYLGQACSRSCDTELQAMIHFLDDRMKEDQVEEGIHYYRRDDMGGFQPRVHHFGWFSHGGPNETWFSYRAPPPQELDVLSDVPSPVWSCLSD